MLFNIMFLTQNTNLLLFYYIGIQLCITHVHVWCISIHIGVVVLWCCGVVYCFDPIPYSGCLGMIALFAYKFDI